MKVRRKCGPFFVSQQISCPIFFQIIINKDHESLAWQRMGEVFSPSQISPGDYNIEDNFVKRQRSHVQNYLRLLNQTGEAKRDIETR